MDFCPFTGYKGKKSSSPSPSAPDWGCVYSRLSPAPGGREEPSASPRASRSALEKAPTPLGQKQSTCSAPPPPPRPRRHGAESGGFGFRAQGPPTSSLWPCGNFPLQWAPNSGREGAPASGRASRGPEEGPMRPPGPWGRGCGRTGTTPPVLAGSRWGPAPRVGLVPKSPSHDPQPRTPCALERREGPGKGGLRSLGVNGAAWAQARAGRRGISSPRPSRRRK